jgi:hypothetical protein
MSNNITDPRKNIGASWENFIKVDTAHDQNRLPADAPRFIEYAWKRFDVKTVIKMLLSGQSAYKALRPILFSGLCTWTVCPKRDSLRQHGMLLVGIEHMTVAEVKGRAAFAGEGISNHDLLGDIMGRLRMLGQDFYSDFYYPVGGLTQVLRSTTPGNFKKNLAKHSENTNIAIAMMQIYDFHFKYLNDKIKWYDASESKGFELVRRIFGEGRRETPIGFDKLGHGWREHIENVAMLYAASTLKIDDKKSFLDVICSGQADYNKYGYIISSWIGRARYVAENFWVNTEKPEIGRDNIAVLPVIETFPTPDPQFSEAERRLIEADFDRIAILKNRKPGEMRVRLSRRGSRTGQ